MSIDTGAATRERRNVLRSSGSRTSHGPVRQLIAVALTTCAMTVGLMAISPADASPRPTPAQTGKYYVVLSSYQGKQEFIYEIAQRFLGNGSRYAQIVALNLNRDEPGGTKFHDPTKIAPGWILRLPGDAKGPGVRSGVIPSYGPPPQTATVKKAAAPSKATRSAPKKPPVRTAPPAHSTNASKPAAPRPAPTADTPGNSLPAQPNVGHIGPAALAPIAPLASTTNVPSADEQTNHSPTFALTIGLFAVMTAIVGLLVSWKRRPRAWWHNRFPHWRVVLPTRGPFIAIRGREGATSSSSPTSAEPEPQDDAPDDRPVDLSGVDLATEVNTNLVRLIPPTVPLLPTLTESRPVTEEPLRQARRRLRWIAPGQPLAAQHPAADSSPPPKLTPAPNDVGGRDADLDQANSQANSENRRPTEPAPQRDVHLSLEGDVTPAAEVAVSADGRIRLTAIPRRAPGAIQPKEPGPIVADRPATVQNLSQSAPESLVLGPSLSSQPVPLVPSPPTAKPPGVRSADLPAAASGTEEAAGNTVATVVAEPSSGHPPAPAEREPQTEPARAGAVAAAWVSIPRTDAATATRWTNHRSTAADRQAFRASLGWRFDAASSYVSRLLSERPGLRGLADDGGAATDLAAVHLFAAADHHDLVAAVRADAVPASQRAFLSCLVAGLLRLPSFTGAVVRGTPAGSDPAAAYRLGDQILEPGPLIAAADSQVTVPGPAELIIWSSTARRLDGLTDDPADVRVVFLPGTAFRVLQINPTTSRSRILLAETPSTWIGRVDDRRDARLLSRLGATGQQRSIREDTSPGHVDPVEWPWADASSSIIPGLAPVFAGALG